MSPSDSEPMRRSIARRCISSVAGLALPAVLGVALFGCGGDHAAACANSTSTTLCATTSDGGEVDPTALLDDFEDGNNLIALVAGRIGGWFSFGDTTPGGHIQPTGDTAPEMIPGGRNGSLRALHVTSTGFLDWGSGVSTAVHYGATEAGAPGLLPYDAHLYKGVTFFARVGDTSAVTVRIQFNDELTRPEGGKCVLDGPPGQQCYDGFGVDLSSLSTTWQAFRIPFSGLSQRGFGLPGSALDTAALYEVGLAFPPGVVTDFWLDDIRFFE
jgi:hypothetical protein